MSRVIVAGSVNMDIVVTTSRYPRVGETIMGQSVKFFPGGKGANQAVAAAKLGGSVSLIGNIGNDSFGSELRVFLEAQHIDLSQLAVHESSTGVAVIVVGSDGENSIIVVSGANAHISASQIQSKIEKGDVLVSQFEIPLPAIETFFKLGRTSGAINILNPAPALACDASVLALADILVLNETEMGFFAKKEVDPDVSEEDLAALAASIRLSPDQTVIITLGERGAFVLASDSLFRVPGRSVTAVDTTGAGDCFVGALATALSEGLSIEAAVKLANTAASISVTRMGAGPSMPTREELDRVIL